MGNYGGYEDEITNLKRDKELLMMELRRLRKYQEVRTHQQLGCLHGHFELPASDDLMLPANLPRMQLASAAEWCLRGLFHAILQLYDTCAVKTSPSPAMHMDTF